MTALASGLSGAVPWFILANKLDLCVGEEYIPASVRARFCNPSRMTLEVLDTLLALWYERQEDPDVEATFRFQRYPDKEGELYIPKPRKRLPTPVQNAQSGPTGPSKRESKRKEKSRKRVKTARSSSRKKSESEGEEFPGLTDKELDNSDDDGSTTLARDRRELEEPKVTRKIKARPISKKKKQLKFEDEMTDSKLRDLDPELQSIHDEVISEKQKKMASNNFGTSDPSMPKIRYRFGPVSRGGAGKDFVGIITPSVQKATRDSPLRKQPDSPPRKQSETPLRKQPQTPPRKQPENEDHLSSLLENEQGRPLPNSSRKRRQEDNDESPPRKLPRITDGPVPTHSAGATSSTAPKIRKNTSREGGGNSPVKKHVALRHDRQTRSSKTQGIQTRSKGKTR